ncbi:MAG TPA: molybdenum cofactor biosynthesis protein MoaE [Opitutaceae bacterium]|jgi:molybdopterin synthase catalytic subunit|nr:molybdenum cofactor biosynthesis protein MoaE [Opitutaceae bacterium]
MDHFLLSSTPIDAAAAGSILVDDGAGAYLTFEGWVRDENEGKPVTLLEYEAYWPLAEKEGERIIEEAFERFPIRGARCVHRVGRLNLGDMAVWVGVTAAHRGAAFDACRYIIDQTKARVPIWKREHFADGTKAWTNAKNSLVSPS